MLNLSDVLLELHGLVVPVKVRHVYAADRMSVQLLGPAGAPTEDDLTIQLHKKCKPILRREDPPVLLTLVGQDADGQVGPGPCPAGRKLTSQLTAKAEACVAHVPVPDRREWLSSLCPGSIEVGELYLRLDEQWLRLSDALQKAGFVDS